MLFSVQFAILLRYKIHAYMVQDL